MFHFDQLFFIHFGAEKVKEYNARDAGDETDDPSQIVVKIKKEIPDGMELTEEELAARRQKLLKRRERSKGPKVPREKKEKKERYLKQTCSKFNTQEARLSCKAKEKVTVGSANVNSSMEINSAKLL